MNATPIPISEDDTLLASDAARVLERSAQGVRYLEDTGRLASIRVGVRRMRVYARRDVERLAVVLRAERTKRESQGAVS